MTKEEAIEEVKNYENYPNGLSKECRDYIIKTLEQEPCEGAIPRSTAIQLVNDVQNNCGFSDYKYYEYLYDHLSTMPSVNPQEPKTGHWKKIQSGDKDFPESIVCSRCGHENSYLDFGISSVPIGKSFKKSKFCPYCGAKMESEDLGL